MTCVIDMFKPKGAYNYVFMSVFKVLYFVCLKDSM